MEQFFVEHTFVSLVSYAIIIGVLIAFTIGCIIILIREVKNLHEEREYQKHLESIKAWHQLGDDYLEVMKELGRE